MYVALAFLKKRPLCDENSIFLSRYSENVVQKRNSNLLYTLRTDL